MKKIIILSVLLLFTVLSFGQDYKEKREKIKALKIAYITEQLDLTTDEAQKFWPIYNANDEKQFELRHKKMRSIINKFENGSLEKLSEKEAASLIDQVENIEDELHDYKKKYIKDLKTVISAKKIIKLKKAEDEFNRKLMKQYKGKK
ncbi:sensor of ECF-type sigma factor [Flavobacterium sp. N2270]|uniref:sensor of ECF-type sigma factor n=1 Tax=Flavobacterium sp. N2270 TaxID=2986831 RepID=UPI0022254C75|nr:sensor of ECF-type sigma factor [Flavobacterium sp. N2270]